jgi:MFS family permease
MHLWWFSSGSVWQLAVFALLFGSCYGGFVALYPALTVDYFGGRNASGIIGFLYTATAVGTLVGPKLAGDGFDLFGSYALPILVSAGCALLAALLILLLPKTATE